MNWTLSIPRKSDKFVIGQHLLVSPFCTAMKPAYSDLDHCPNPIQEEGSQCTSRHHARLVEEHRIDLYGVSFK